MVITPNTTVSVLKAANWLRDGATSLIESGGMTYIRNSFGNIIAIISGDDRFRSRVASIILGRVS